MSDKHSMTIAIIEWRGVVRVVHIVGNPISSKNKNSLLSDNGLIIQITVVYCLNDSPVVQVDNIDRIMSRIDDRNSAVRYGC